VIAVVHLVWGPLGVAPLREFLASYARHPAGAEHELVVLFNGVGDGLRPQLQAELEGVEHRLLATPEPVQDLAAYAYAAECLRTERMCLLNSHSAILAPRWLGKLDDALDQPRVGLAGVSGSWASMRSYALYHLGLPSAYRRVWPDRAATLGEFRALDAERTGPRPARGPIRHLHTARALLDMLIGFPSFPAEHMRTNAFMAQRRLLGDVLNVGMRRKVDAHRLESGSRGLTRGVERAGLRVVVVDRAGRQFERADWPESETFWQGDQRGVLVSDNQTESYRLAGAERRRLLSTYAWGERAAPVAHAGPFRDPEPAL
jgi:hypothetical protein